MCLTRIRTLCHNTLLTALPCCRVGRSQGAGMKGQLMPASEGRYFEAALRQQWQQLAGLRTALEAATGLIVSQGAQLARLQLAAEGPPASQPAAAGGSPSWQAELSWQRPAASPPAAAAGSRPRSQNSSHGPRPKTAEGARPVSASPSKLSARSPSPAGSLPARPSTSSHLGMMTSIKSDLEAWRAK
jgi:hypothetical protein